MDRIRRLAVANNSEYERNRSGHSNYTFDPKERGESRMLVNAMWRNGTFDQSRSGSNNGNKWQPVSDLEWCRLFEKSYLNKRVDLSHSESYAVESNEGKPKMKKGKKKKGGKGGQKGSKSKSSGGGGDRSATPPDLTLNGLKSGQLKTAPDRDSILLEK